MQDLPTDTKQRMPSSQVLEEVIHLSVRGDHDDEPRAQSCFAR
jgi:hypothetical protein